MKTRFDTSSYELDRPLPKGKNEKVIGLIKDNLGGKIMTQFVGLRTNNYSYLIDDSSKDKKVKGTKTCAIKIKLKFQNYKNCLEATQLGRKISYIEKNDINVNSLKKDHKEFIKNNKLILKTQQSSRKHNVFTEEINRTTLCSNGDKSDKFII